MKPTLCLALCAALALVGCKSAADYQRNNSATAAWLDAHAGRPAMNIAGPWTSPDWGDGQFEQTGSKVTGILDGYPVGGVIRGTTLYLAITSGGWTDYTAVLRQQYDGALTGTYSEQVPFSAEDETSMVLRRIQP